MPETVHPGVQPEFTHSVCEIHVPQSAPASRTAAPAEKHPKTHTHHYKYLQHERANVDFRDSTYTSRLKRWCVNTCLHTYVHKRPYPKHTHVTKEVAKHNSEEAAFVTSQSDPTAAATLVGKKRSFRQSQLDMAECGNSKNTPLCGAPHLARENNTFVLD